MDRRVPRRRAEPLRTARPRAEQPHRRGRSRAPADDAVAPAARRPDAGRHDDDEHTASGRGRRRRQIGEAFVMRQIEILDTTLRDGEQAPGAALGAAAKLRMARSLADLGVDAIEAGFPAASAEELEAVRDIARAVDGSTIVALARATDGDVDAAAKALAPAARKRIHVFISTSEIH